MVVVGVVTVVVFVVMVVVGVVGVVVFVVVIVVGVVGVVVFFGGRGDRRACCSPI